MNRLVFIFNIFITVIIVCMGGFLENLSAEYLKWQCVLVDIYAIILAICILRNFLHPYIMFMFTFNLFICSRIWLDVLDIGNPFYYTYFFTQYEFSVPIQKEICYVITLVFLGANLALLFHCLIGTTWKAVIIRNEKVLQTSKVLMLVCLLPTIAYFYEMWKMVSENGYLILYSAQASGVENKSFLGHFFALFQMSFFSFLAACPNKKEFKMYSVLFIVTSACSLVMGARSQFATSLLAFMTYYSLYVNRISIKKLIVIGSICLVCFQIIGLTRMNDDSNEFDLNMSNIATVFLRQQGVSITVLGYAAELNDGSIMDFVYPLTAYIESKLDEDYYNELPRYAFPHRISMEINPKLYLNGFGTGSSFVAEAYSAGGCVLVFSFSCFVILLLFYLMKKFNGHTWGIFCMIIFWKELYFMPRGSCFGFCGGMIKNLVIMYFLVYLCNMFKYSKISKQSSKG